MKVSEKVGRFHDIIFNRAPTFLEEGSGETIHTGCFATCHLVDVILRSKFPSYPSVGVLSTARSYGSDVTRGVYPGSGL